MLRMRVRILPLGHGERENSVKTQFEYITFNFSQHSLKYSSNMQKHFFNIYSISTNASIGSWTQPPELGMMNRVFYHCATQTKNKFQLKYFIVFDRLIFKNFELKRFELFLFSIFETFSTGDDN
jgi:hypothetical protein